jgi:taurine dioxygenase
MSGANGATEFKDVVGSLDELRALMGEPSEIALRKDIARIDEHCRAFIARAHFLLVATADHAGRCDVSPKGDAPGFVLVVDDHTLLIPDRPGNKRFDGMGSARTAGRAHLPGAGQRGDASVNGRPDRARSRSGGALAAQAHPSSSRWPRSLSSIAQCVKRSGLGSPRAGRTVRSSLAEMFRDHASPPMRWRSSTSVCRMAWKILLRECHVPIEVRPITGSLGAEIHGVDLGADLDAATVAAIRRALLDHCVVFFRDQQFDATQHKALARRFGDIFVHPNYATVVPDPEIIEIRREPGDVRIVGEEWHTDTTMMAEPPMGAILYAIEVPPYGGDTLFASQYLAYEALSDGMKRLLESLRAVHSDRKVAGPQAGMNAYRATKVREEGWEETVSAHPVVRTHPETGRKLLFVNHSYTIRFEGMTDAESAPLLGFLLEHGHRPEFTCRFRWANGSVAFWDNRWVKHLAVHDAGRFRRIMRRVQIAGDKPV